MRASSQEAKATHTEAIPGQCRDCVWLVRLPRSAQCRVFLGSIPELPPKGWRLPDGTCQARETRVEAYRAWSRASLWGTPYTPPEKESG